jgi:iron complex outermembrane receptor protein
MGATRAKRPSVTGALGLGLLLLAGPTAAQDTTGRITGTVVLDVTGEPLHGATVIVVGPGRAVVTDSAGTFTIAGLAPGAYEVVATREHLTAGRLTVQVTAGGTATAEFRLSISSVHEEVTVTASLGTATAYEAFNAVSVVDSFELAKDMSGTLGDVLEKQPGIAKRSFGAGNSRPIIRGFDGDRVLILENGMRTGDLSSQSGDHGVSIDPAGLDRLEVVRGPATLLYGSNAIGGVVNAITPHEVFETSPTEGVHGQIVTDAGSANRQAGANASLHVGRARWNYWAGGGSRRSGDYETPLGRVENSGSRLSTGRAGFGYSGQKTFFSLGAQAEDGAYGVPFAGLFEGEEDARVSLETERQVVRADVGARHLDGFAESVRVIANYTRWHHDEVEEEDGEKTIGTQFDNDVFGLRVELAQRAAGRLSGKVGASFEHRRFDSQGAEALAPATRHTSVAGFAFEELAYGRTRVQFGARVERSQFRPDPRAEAEGDAHLDAHDEPEPPEAIDRTFTGFSGSAGLHVDLTGSAAVVANVTRSYRSPALEELYNFGPHVGNLAFEIGSPDLEREASTGLDISLRSRGRRARGQINAYYYRIDNFVFPDFTDDVLDGLRVARFVQGDSRFAGVDASGRVEFAANAWLAASVGYVNAALTGGTALPRIPPLHGNVTLEMPAANFTIEPELEWAARQGRVFTSETPTGGWATLNLGLTYVVTRAHLSHLVSVRGYNLTDETYRNHTSFIKDLAPELGRGVKVSYSVRFF